MTWVYFNLPLTMMLADKLKNKMQLQNSVGTSPHSYFWTSGTKKKELD
jgi:hypothetical protein